MPSFIAKRTFQTGKKEKVRLVKVDTVIDATEREVREEMAKGFHPKTKKPMSSLLNHCDPADAAASALVEEFYKGREKPEEGKPEEGISEEEELENIRAQIVEMGGQYDKRWGLTRTKQEYLNLRKTKGNRR